MKISDLKKLNNKMPDTIKMLCAPLIRRGLIKNHVFLRQYYELIEADQLNEKGLLQIQSQKLKEILIFAYENTAYYKSLFDSVGFNPYSFSKIKEISIIPTLTTDKLEENYQELQAGSIDNYYEVTTGGSTGKPKRFTLERDSIYKEKAFIYHFWSKFGYDYKKSRIATFRGMEFNGKLSKVNPLYNEIMLNPFILNSKLVSKYCRKIESFKADFIHGYPSAIAHFCKLMKKENIRLKTDIKGVFFISENVYSEQINIIEEILQCKTHSFYGHSERSCFAAQNNGEGYSFNPLYGYTEFKNITKGDIICTGFLNRKMPLIRYELDDFAELCGSGNYQIFGHHSSEVLIGKNNEEISMAAVNFHDLTFQSITGYQFVQHEVGKVTLHVTSEEGLNESDISYIQDGLNKKLGTVLDCEIQIVDKLTLSPRGKFKMVIQHIKNIG